MIATLVTADTAFQQIKSRSQRSAGANGLYTRFVFFGRFILSKADLLLLGVQSWKGGSKMDQCVINQFPDKANVYDGMFDGD